MVREIFQPAPIIGPARPQGVKLPEWPVSMQPSKCVGWCESRSPPAPKGYGTYPIEGSLQKPQKPPSLELRGQMNILAVVAAVVLPLVLFTVVSATLSFSLHHTHPEAAYTIVLAGLLAVLLLFLLARDERQRRAGDREAKVAGYALLFASCLAAWLLGVCLGFVNFHVNMRPCYEIGGLKTYVGVDPAVSRGQQMMDAGRVVFADGVQLDLSRAAAFRSASSTYCVAPIANGENTTLAAYDFWVGGEDCCSAVAPGQGFHCGAALDADAKAGIRILGQQDYYGLAIHQAEAVHDLLAVHPLLFRWTHDPLAEAAHQQSSGFRLYYLGILMFFTFQISLLGFGAVIMAAKTAREQKS